MCYEHWGDIGSGGQRLQENVMWVSWMCYEHWGDIGSGGKSVHLAEGCRFDPPPWVCRSVLGKDA